jgi:transcriptional regulator with XRE-family HTH domain
MNKSTEKLHPLTTALAAARHRAGLSQRALADKVGLAQSHISKIERGAVDPQASSLIEVARVLGLELSLVPTQLVPALRALIRETVPNPRGLPHSLDHELTRLARRARALMKKFPDLKVLPGIALTADELRMARLDEPAYAEARSSIVTAHAILDRLRDLSQSQPTTAAVRNAAEPLEPIRQTLQSTRNSWTHRDTRWTQSPAYRLNETDA